MTEMRYEMINGRMYIEKTVTVGVDIRKKGLTKWKTIHNIGTSEDDAFNDLRKRFPSEEYEFRYLTKDYTGEGDFGEITFEDDDNYCQWYVPVEDFLDTYKEYAYEAEVLLDR